MPTVFSGGLQQQPIDDHQPLAEQRPQLPTRLIDLLRALSSSAQQQNTETEQKRYKDPNVAELEHLKAMHDHRRTQQQHESRRTDEREMRNLQNTKQKLRSINEELEDIFMN